MKRTLWQKRIPTLAGLLLVLLAIGATTLLTQYGRAILTKASPTLIPKDIKITNVSDSSFTVTWLTDEAVIGSIQVTEGTELKKSVLDDQDQLSQTTSGRKIHSVTVSGLKPNTTYSYKILSAGNLYDNNGIPYSVKTAPTLTQNGKIDNTASGNVILSSGQEASGTLVFFNIRGSQLLSTIVKDSGNYQFLLSTLRTVDLANFYHPSDEEIIELTMIGVDSTTSKARTFFKNRAKIPSITLGKDYDFTSTIPTPSPSKEATSSSLFTAPKSQEGGKQPSILSPKKDESFTDQTPIFRGTAPSGVKLKITIESENPIEETITADANGTWSYQPKTKLTAGPHKITITVPDQNGMMRILTQAFTVLAEGTQVVEAATPSATPTVKLSPTPTSSPSASPTITPSATATATATPKLTATPTPILTTTPVPTAAPLPQSATVLPSLVFGSFGILLFLLGFSLLIFKK